jgi:sugar phosphate isomerase/epimerase
MKFPIGFVSAILPDFSFEEVIDFAALHGFSHVELMCWPVGKANRRYAGVTHIDAETITEEKAAYINEYCRSKAVSISGLGYYPNPLDTDLAKRKIYQEHLVSLISCAKLLGVATVNTFIGRDKTLNLPQNIELFTTQWKPILEHAKQQGIRIAIENCPMYFTHDEFPDGQNIAFNATVWEQLFAHEYGEVLGLNYDPSHLLWMQMDYLAPLKGFTHKLFHLHLKDAEVHAQKLAQVGILATPLEYHTPRLPGRGQIDWAQYLKVLSEINYQGPLIIEFEDKAFEGSLEKVTEGLLFTKKYIQDLMA